MEALITPFHQTTLETSGISWPRCQLLYTELQKAIAFPAVNSSPAVNPRYRRFVALNMDTAWQNRAIYGVLSQHIAAEELEQMN